VGKLACWLRGCIRIDGKDLKLRSLEGTTKIQEICRMRVGKIKQEFESLLDFKRRKILVKLSQSYWFQLYLKQKSKSRLCE
jgi:hypothetical protein